MPSNILNTHHIALAGTHFGPSHYTPSDLQRWITNAGGTYLPKLTASCTTLICSDKAWQTKAPVVVTALKQYKDKVAVVTWDWLEDSVRKGRCLVTKRYLWRKPERKRVFGMLGDWRRLKGRQGRVVLRGAADEGKVVKRLDVEWKLRKGKYHVYCDEKGVEYDISLTRSDATGKLLERYGICLYTNDTTFKTKILYATTTTYTSTARSSKPEFLAEVGSNWATAYGALELFFRGKTAKGFHEIVDGGRRVVANGWTVRAKGLLKVEGEAKAKGERVEVSESDDDRESFSQAGDNAEIRERGEREAMDVKMEERENGNESETEEEEESAGDDDADMEGAAFPDATKSKEQDDIVTDAGMKVSTAPRIETEKEEHELDAATEEVADSRGETDLEGDEVVVDVDMREQASTPREHLVRRGTSLSERKSLRPKAIIQDDSDSDTPEPPKQKKQKKEDDTTQKSTARIETANQTRRNPTRGSKKLADSYRELSQTPIEEVDEKRVETKRASTSRKSTIATKTSAARTKNLARAAAKAIKTPAAKHKATPIAKKAQKGVVQARETKKRKQTQSSAWR